MKTAYSVIFIVFLLLGCNNNSQRPALTEYRTIIVELRPNETIVDNVKISNTKNVFENLEDPENVNIEVFADRLAKTETYIEIAASAIKAGVNTDKIKLNILPSNTSSTLDTPTKDKPLLHMSKEEIRELFSTEYLAERLEVSGTKMMCEQPMVSQCLKFGEASCEEVLDIYSDYCFRSARQETPEVYDGLTSAKLINAYKICMLMESTVQQNQRDEDMVECFKRTPFQSGKALISLLP